MPIRRLRPGSPQTIYLSDDLGAAKQAGELAKCELRVRLVQFVYTDTFDLWLNGEQIPRSNQEWLDWTYSVRIVPGAHRVMDAYWITVDLLRLGPLPLRGDNSVQVNLTRRDPRADPALLLHDVELIVQYRDHRHAPRRDEAWDDTRQMSGPV